MIGQCRAKMGHGRHFHVASREVSLEAILNSGYEPPLRDRDRERDRQSRQTAPEGDHRGDPGDDPERSDDPVRSGDCVVGATGSVDPRVPHVCLARSLGHRLMRRLCCGTSEQRRVCPICGDGDLFHTQRWGITGCVAKPTDGRIAETGRSGNAARPTPGSATPRVTEVRIAIDPISRFVLPIVSIAAP